ncbi:MAG: hypothetical protein RLZZ621_31 [Gemmatimonadota bacterium]
MEARIAQLKAGLEAGTLDPNDARLAKKLFKAIAHLAREPKHPGLNSHEIAELSRRFSTEDTRHKVFESYLENNTPSAGRLFWVYGPQHGMITLIGLEPHPEDGKNAGYARVKLSGFPKGVAEPNSAYETCATLADEHRATMTTLAHMYAVPDLHQLASTLPHPS